MSGDIAGHEIVWTASYCKKCCTIRALCGLALSSMNIGLSANATVDIMSSPCSIWLVTWSFGVDYSHMEMGPLVWWKSFFVTPYRRSCKGAWSEHIVTVFLACQITITNVQVQLTVKGKTTPDSYTPTPKSSCAQNEVVLKWSVSLVQNPCTTFGRDFIGRKINQHNPKCQNIDELRTAILQELQQFLQERLRHLVRSMTRCVTELHNKRGGYTKYVSSWKTWVWLGKNGVQNRCWKNVKPVCLWWKFLTLR
jgi:hypothetical protein